VYFFNKGLQIGPIKSEEEATQMGGEKQGKTEERDFGFPSELQQTTILGIFAFPHNRHYGPNPPDIQKNSHHLTAPSPATGTNYFRLIKEPQETSRRLGFVLGVLPLDFNLIKPSRKFSPRSFGYQIITRSSSLQLISCFLQVLALK
jgi:hypothetical protein